MTPTLSRSALSSLSQLVPSVYPEKVIQFGSGNFLRAFFNWQLQQMNDRGLFGGSAVLVQTFSKETNPTYAEQDYLFTVLLNGIQDGQTVDSVQVVSSISRLVNPYTDYTDYLSLADNEELTFIVSNTTEAGIVYRSEDRPNDVSPTGFPAKLTALLHRRYTLGKPGFTVIPCELIERSGEKLLEIVQKHADDWELGEEFKQWLDRENTFCSSLVDRIVPGFPQGREQELEAKLGYRDKLMVTAEPYLFWAIEGPQRLTEELPLTKAGLNVIVTSDMTPYRQRKVHLLNGPHTAMVPLGMLAGLETVEDVMNDEVFSAFVRSLIEQELIPMLDLPADELHSYAEAVLDRFRNPSIRHELRSIALNSISKFQARLLPILLRYTREHGQLPPRITLAFAALLYSYSDERIPRQDEASVLELFDRARQEPESFTENILQESALWGSDLNEVPGLAARLNGHIHELQASGSRALLHQLV
ncbi:tagaturonate reductase [Saccharibacillus kuerlensis]|uniref:Mannitol dehydrogenase n=1 Tax=Saccharibacillus kuerlensis TaxID=459527 RepID=A0ABQ2L9A9_9BACL|nr:tagaturonate reductase [Saccharibacillus kuerlensis]GGO07557.1 mannitol dehydrogenase [Saccharibacillus kuerlensis]